MSENELQRLTRRYTAEIFPIIGPEIDIPAPDVGTNAQTMAWMMDTYSMQKGYSVPGVVTGKPIPIGGSLGREEATGRGVVYVVLEAMKHLKLNPRKSMAVVQGFGNVGSHAARILAEYGITVIAVSDSKGGIYNQKGLDIAKLHLHYLNTHTLEGFPGCDQITNEALLELSCTVLVPAALSEVITEKNAHKLKCKILAEGAKSMGLGAVDRTFGVIFGLVRGVVLLSLLYLPVYLLVEKNETVFGQPAGVDVGIGVGQQRGDFSRRNAAQRRDIAAPVSF